ncbi:MAG: hypothetical protein JSV89_12080 [Spirochaetaceae bacterium]|nr:MAG: hypothetical protein JSV89_12080 [Spirochaetaceae bacterium]
MTRGAKLIRLFAALAGLTVFLVAAFSIILPWIPTWGATEEETARTLPGDELLSDPAVMMTHGIGIEVPPESVWPWIAQIGDVRGAFYSYTFIENLIAGERMYVNADRIIPQLQNPRVGDQLIEGGMLNVYALEEGSWLLGSADPEFPLGWTWIWAVFPEGPDRTRLISRFRIQPPGELDGNALVGFIMTTGSFVMARKMMQGIKDRGEGRIEAPYVQPLEIAVWLLALATGIFAAVSYVRRRRWWQPLVVGIASVLALLCFTFGQPVVWLRVLVDLILIGGLYWVWRRKPRAAVALSEKLEDRLEHHE